MSKFYRSLAMANCDKPQSKSHNTKVCEKCGCEYQPQRSRADVQKYCSRNCLHEALMKSVTRVERDRIEKAVNKRMARGNIEFWHGVVDYAGTQAERVMLHMEGTRGAIRRVHALGLVRLFKTVKRELERRSVEENEVVENV